MKTNTHFLSYVAHLFLEGDMFQTKFVVKIKTYLLYSTFFFNHAICEIMWKNIVETDRLQRHTQNM